MDPKGKIALVTGAARDFGLVITLELLRQGVKGVAVCDINVVEGEKVVEKIQKEFGEDKAIFIKTDVTNNDEFNEAFKKTIQTFGTLDIVINNAFIVNETSWKQVVAINLIGSIQGLILSLEYMGKDKGGKGGVVVNTGSISGLGSGSVVLPVYNATKFGIVGLTLSFGSEFVWNTSGVRVTTICPGYTEINVTKTVNADSNITLREDWMPRLLQDMADHGKPQPAENVGRGVLHIIREAANGSIWVCENNEPPYEVKIPQHQEMRV